MKVAANEEHKENTPSEPEYLPISVYTLEHIVQFVLIMSSIQVSIPVSVYESNLFFSL